MKKIIIIVITSIIFTGCMKSPELLDHKEYKGWVVIEISTLGHYVTISNKEKIKTLKLYELEFNQFHLGDTIK